MCGRIDHHSREEYCYYPNTLAQTSSDEDTEAVLKKLTILVVTLSSGTTLYMYMWAVSSESGRNGGGEGKLPGNNRSDGYWRSTRLLPDNWTWQHVSEEDV